MYSISSCDFGHRLVDNFVPTGIGTLIGLQSCMLSLFGIPSMYFCWLSQSFLLSLFLWHFPSMKCASPRSYMSNLEDIYCFTSSIRSMLFTTNNMLSTYNATHMKWFLTCLIHTQWSDWLLLNPKPCMYESNVWYHILGDFFNPERDSWASKPAPPSLWWWNL